MYKIFTLAFILLSVVVKAQELEVQGRVLDEATKPIAGANVIIKGTPNGVVTNSDGSFKINIPYGKVKLLFAYVGYKSFEQTLHVNKDFNWRVEATLVRKGGIGKGSGKIVKRTE